MEIEDSPAEVRKVKRVQFGILSSDEIRAMSVCEILQPSIFDSNGIPKDGGVMDVRMGTVDRGYLCRTCSGNRQTCPGHFGHIELAKPVFHVGFLAMTIKVLQSICYHCSRLLCADSDNQRFAEALKITDPRKRFIEIHRLSHGKKYCGRGDKMDDNEDDEDVIMRMRSGCGARQPSYRKGKGIKIEIQFKSNEIGRKTPNKRPELHYVGDEDDYIKKDLSPTEVMEIFKRISDRDRKVLGFDVGNNAYTTPERLLINVLPVSPPAMRPFVMRDGMRPCQDDLTYKLNDIVKTNDALKRQQARGIPDHILSDLVELLQYHVTTMIDNEVSGQPQSKQKSGKPIKSLRERLVGKAGRIRGNLMGKRCDFSARTVIGGDPNLSIDEVGVPRSIAMNLTYPERVTRWNIYKMKQLVENGPNQHPGAKTIIRDDGKQIDLRWIGRTSDMNLEPGYIVERHIQNGDIVLFNRQPSLHKMSMMAHHVKILPWSTFRLNLSVTSPYNADFDGDEMNLHVPQSEVARAELIELAKVPTQIITPQSNAPVMGIVQDALLGVMKFTKRDQFFNREEVFNLMMYLDDSWDGIIPFPAILKPKRLWTGKQILSMIIPPNTNAEFESNGRPDEDNKYHSPTDTYVKIKHGELMTGIVDKRTVGTSEKSLIHIIFKDEGATMCMKFINQLNNLMNAYLLDHSSSVGISDCVTNADIQALIRKEISKKKKKALRCVKQWRMGALEKKPGLTYKQVFEAEIKGILNEEVSIRDSLHRNNNFKQMLYAGSKGSPSHMNQIIAAVGAQNILGKRVQNGFTDRTLPHFLKGDLGPEAGGYIENSFIHGLTPQETFFHAISGRVGIIDTACKTATTGYIQRRLIKAMEHIMTCYDFTVRDSSGNIIQFLYGEDGLDAQYIEKQRMSHITMSDKEFEEIYQFDLLDGNWRGDIFLEPVIKGEIEEDHEAQIILRRELQQLQEDRIWFKENMFGILANSAMVYLPVNIARLIRRRKQEFDPDAERMKDSKYSELNPVEIIKEVNQLCEEIRVLPGIDESNENATKLMTCMIRSELASKRMCQVDEYENRMTWDCFKSIIDAIKDEFDRSKVDPGECVGTIAAQSLGQPITQMTLSTFHHTGTSKTNITLGLPRIVELINVAKNIKTPIMTIYLRSDIARDQYRAKSVMNRLEFLRLGDLVTQTEVYYDPDIRESVVEQDREFLEYFTDFPDQDSTDFIEDVSPWMIRMELNRVKKEGKGIRMNDIADMINSMWRGDVRCFNSNDNAEKLVLQIRTHRNIHDEEDDITVTDNDQDVKFCEKFAQKLRDETILGGIHGINKVFMREENQGAWDESGQWEHETNPEWVFDAEGSGSDILLDVMACDEVDYTRTTSNNIIHIFEVFGIEAARQALYNELRNAISFDGSYVNFRHLSILIDTMTCQGNIMSITRHGINRRDTGPIMRSSFEETVEILLEAAQFGMEDDLLGCSENILLGQLCPIGTGAFDLVLDTQMLENVEISWDEEKAAEMDIFTDLQDAVISDDFGTPQWDESPLWRAMSPMASPSRSPSPCPSFSPMADGGCSPIFPIMDGSPDDSSSYSSFSSSGDSSPNYSPTSPNYSPTSPNYSPTSPNYSPTSPQYSPTSPQYSPTSPNYSPTSPTYSPTSPVYNPSSVNENRSRASYSGVTHSPTYSPTSATYSPTSPNYSPTSPVYSPTSPHYSPTSPHYSPTSPTYSPYSPTHNNNHNNNNNGYSPTSPAYSPNHSPPVDSSPNSLSSPSSPTSPSSPISPTSPTSPTSPSSPLQYSPTWNAGNENVPSSEMDYSSSAGSDSDANININAAADEHIEQITMESSEIATPESSDSEDD